jgi:hypothetical protein
MATAERQHAYRRDMDPLPKPSVVQDHLMLKLVKELEH